MSTLVPHLLDALPDKPLGSTVFSRDSMLFIATHFDQAARKSGHAAHPLRPDRNGDMTETWHALTQIDTSAPDSLSKAAFPDFQASLKAMDHFENYHETYADISRDYRHRMRLILRNVVSFFYRWLPVGEAGCELILRFCRAILVEDHPEAAPEYGHGVLGSLEVLTHVNRYVMLKEFDKPFSEHLLHQSLVFYMGTQVLNRFRPSRAGGTKDLALVYLVRDVLRRQIDVCRERLERGTPDASEDEPLCAAPKFFLEAFKERELEDLLSVDLAGEAGCRLVMEVWALTSLLHDYGYYVATVWDLHNYNRGSLQKEVRVIDCMRKLEILGELGDHDTFLENLQFLTRCAPYIDGEHISQTLRWLANVAERMKAGNMEYYIAGRRQFHPFWSVVELWKRYMQSLDSMPPSKRLAFLIAMRAVYSHHYAAKADADRSGGLNPTLEDNEAEKEIKFREAPFAFLLLLLDSGQNFLRFRFSKEKEQGLDKSEGKRPEILIPLTELDLQIVLREREIGGKARSRILEVIFAGSDQNRSKIEGLRERVEQSNALEKKFSDAAGPSADLPLFLVSVKELEEVDLAAKEVYRWPDYTKVEEPRSYLRLPKKEQRKP